MSGVTVKRKGKRSVVAQSVARIEVLADRIDGRIVVEWKDPISESVEKRLLLTYLPEGLAWLMTGSIEYADDQIFYTDGDQQDVIETINDYLDRAGNARWGVLR